MLVYYSDLQMLKMRLDHSSISISITASLQVIGSEYVLFDSDLV